MGGACGWVYGSVCVGGCVWIVDVWGWGGCIWGRVYVGADM